MRKRTISFNEQLHRYTDEDNLVYTSVTTLIGKYTPPFNRNYWSKYKAEQTGLSQQQILENWDNITEEACARGTREHKLLEDSVNGSILPPSEQAKVISEGVEKKKLLSTALVPLSGVEFTNVNLDVLAQSELAKKYPEIFSYLRVAILDGAKLYVERRTYSYDHLVAGTIDCLLVKGRQFIIVDWKTNKKEMHFKSGYYKKVNGIESTQWIDTSDTLLYPLHNLPHCKGAIYTMQLSLYAYILELWGLECKGLVLYHIRPDHRPKAYNILYDKFSAQILLEHHKSTLTNISNGSSPPRQRPRLGIT